MKVVTSKALCKSVYNHLSQIIGERNFKRVAPLTERNAYVFETKHFYYLMSFDTVVAVIEKEMKICIDFLFLIYGYTPLGSHYHIAKFCEDYGATTIYRYR